MLVDEATRSAAAEAVAPLAESLDLAGRLAPYAPLTWSGSWPTAPILAVDDVSAIPFLDGIAGVEEYQHRARLRAGDGDLFAAGTIQTPGYEAYCRDTLGLGEVEFIHAEPKEGPLAVAGACSHGQALDRLVERARHAGALAIHPYMGIEAVWQLGSDIASAGGVPVTVIAPPTPVTWIANDKAAFADVVNRVLGPDWLVETYESRSPSDIATHLVDLASRHERVALKRLRCASAMGNEVFDSSDLRRKPGEELRLLVDSFLERTHWQGDEDVQAVAWENTDISPSTQLWIPPLAVGPPRLDGVYVQILEGEHGVFIGSRPSTLPGSVNRQLASASLRVASALQALGYVGRCSFDFLAVGDPASECELLFTECNGRWGGTSTPMALLDRIVGGSRPPYRAQDFERPGLVGATFAEVLQALHDELYTPATGSGRYVLYNVGPLLRSGKLDVIALGETQEEAEEAMETALPKLLGV